MNKSLSQLGGQLLGIWKQLGLNQRISVVLAAGAVFAALLALGIWSSQVDYALLYGKLDESEAAKVVSVLDEAKTPYQVGQGGGAIYVPRDQVHATRMQLASRGIPRGEGVGFEIFDKPNFGISDFVQRANYVRAVQGELARTISQLDEVETARVMIVVPENRLLIGDNRKPTASVFIRARGSSSLPDSSVNSIRFLVANAVEGLQVGNVSVVDNFGNVLSQNSEEGSITGLTSSQLAARRELEHYLARKAEGMLQTVLGPGQAVVRVAAEINLDTMTQTEEKFDPDGQVMRSSTTDDETTETVNGSGSGGAPGVAANTAPDTNSLAATPVNNTRTKKKTIQSDYEINKTVSSSTQLAGGIKRLTAAVFVASRFEGTGEARQAVTRTPEELDKLRRIVQNALGIDPASPEANELVVLEEMTFSDPFGMVAEDMNSQANRQFWVNQVQTFLYPGLAVALFGVFFLLLKRTASHQLAPATPSSRTAGPASSGGSLGGDGDIPVAYPGRDTHGQPAVMSVDVFNQLVRDNPDNMAHAIHSWLGKGKKP